jgi:hypothetical protein
MSDWWDNMTGVDNLPDVENIFSGGGEDRLDLENLPSFFTGLPLYARDPYADEGGFADATISKGTQSGGGVETADQEYRTSPASGDTSFSRMIKDMMGAGGAKGLLGKGLDFATSKGGLAALMALLAYLDRQKSAPQGGGTTEAYAGYSKPLSPQVVPGKYGPIRTYAANGGLMHAYAQGGTVQMEDGGFVMTKKAVDGAGGPRGIQQLVPGARMIGGPPDPTGKRDLTRAVIHGRNGTTPAKVSRGEAYVPRAAVRRAGGPDRMYEIMKKLQRSA